MVSRDVGSAEQLAHWNHKSTNQCSCHTSTYSMCPSYTHMQKTNPRRIKGGRNILKKCMDDSLVEAGDVHTDIFKILQRVRLGHSMINSTLQRTTNLNPLPTPSSGITYSLVTSEVCDKPQWDQTPCILTELINQGHLIGIYAWIPLFHAAWCNRSSSSFVPATIITFSWAFLKSFFQIIWSLSTSPQLFLKQ